MSNKGNKASADAMRISRAFRMMQEGVHFTEGYNLIADMTGKDFMAAAKLLEERDAMAKKILDIGKKHAAKDTDTFVDILRRAARAGDHQAIDLLADGVLEKPSFID